MPRIHFAVLAHANEPCVADLVRCLWDLNPGATVSLFNGGRNKGFFAGQGVSICPYSSPLRYGNLTAFHIGVMRWLQESREEYDFLVTLDHDMLPLREGLADYLGARMGHVSYMGARFRVADDPANWKLGGSTVEQVNQSWKSRWQPLFGTDVPYWSFNPGQVFSKGLVERILAYPRLTPLMELATRSRIWAMEEMVYPTLAVAVGAETKELPGEHGLLFDSHSSDRLRELAVDPDVFFVHRVGMQLASPDRQVIHELIKDMTPRLEQMPVAEGPLPPSLTRLQWARGTAINAVRRRYDSWHVRHRA